MSSLLMTRPKFLIPLRPFPSSLGLLTSLLYIRTSCFPSSHYPSLAPSRPLEIYGNTWIALSSFLFSEEEADNEQLCEEFGDIEEEEHEGEKREEEKRRGPEFTKEDRCLIGFI